MSLFVRPPFDGAQVCRSLSFMEGGNDNAAVQRTGLARGGYGRGHPPPPAARHSLTVRVLYAGSAVIADSVNGKAIHCFAEKRCVWSAKCGEAGFVEFE